MSRPRSFDYDEAKRLRAEGVTYKALAARFCVSEKTIYLAVNDAARRRDNALSTAYQRSGVCDECGGSCVPASHASRRVHAAADGRTLCIRCRGRARATTVAEDTLQCGDCRQWKPDDAFPRNRTESLSRRGRHRICRGCQAAMRRRARHNRRVPCTSCGKPRAHPADRGGNGNGKQDTGLCLSCYRTSRRSAA